MKTKLYVQGMTCTHCESNIETTLKQLESVEHVRASASKNVAVIHHETELNLILIGSKLEEIGYTLVETDRFWLLKRSAMLFLLLVISYFVLRFGNSLSFNTLPNIRQNMGYGALFVVGTLTSVHCIAMCGGINIGQCNKYKHMKPSKPSLLYNLGRVTSYTILGGVIGSIGSVLSFSGQARGYITIAVSVVMIMMAIKMLKLFQVNLPSVGLPFFIKKPILILSSKGPFFVGIANGFMPCGPLQSMQLYALGTGSALRGALSMFYFSIGTFPLMFALGFISSLLEHRFSKHVMKFSGLLIFALGLNMLSGGVALAGMIIPFQHNGPTIESTLTNDNVQEIRIELQANRYEPLRVKKDIPFKLIIHADASNMNGCNNPIIIPSFGIEQTLIPGENEILFTPVSAGKITYTCWMGMITSYIEVIE